MFVFVDVAASMQINRVISHPTLPVAITAHDDRSIKFTDNNAGQFVYMQLSPSCLLYSMLTVPEVKI